MIYLCVGGNCKKCSDFLQLDDLQIWHSLADIIRITHAGRIFWKTEIRLWKVPIFLCKSHECAVSDIEASCSCSFVVQVVQMFKIKYWEKHFKILRMYSLVACFVSFHLAESLLSSSFLCYSFTVKFTGKTWFKKKFFLLVYITFVLKEPACSRKVEEMSATMSRVSVVNLLKYDRGG